MRRHAGHRRVLSPAWSLAVTVIVVLLGVARVAGAEPAHMRLLVPGESNLQLLSFWAARGAGYFEDEGVALDLVVPESPALAQSAFTNGAASAALLPRPMVLRLAQERFPFTVVANLLTNDPINLVVPRATAFARGIRPDAPLVERLRALHGLRVGIAPNPGPRLRALFASVGLDADKEITIVILHGKDQNAALANGEVDALYAHTPYGERALVDQDCVVVVNQSAGEVPVLAGRDIHVLAVTRGLVDSQPRSVAAMVRALARGEALVHRDQAATVNAVLRALPSLDRAHVERLVALYEPAVPRSPVPSAAVLAREIALYPEMGEAPDLHDVDLARFVDARFAAAIDVPPSRPKPSALELAALVALAIALLFAWLETREIRPGRVD